ncbi:hypothetical protein L9F63_004053, partial [Diploptera punctata]
VSWSILEDVVVFFVRISFLALKVVLEVFRICSNVRSLDNYSIEFLLLVS